MSRNFKAYDRDQMLMLPPSLRDWVAEDDLSWFICDTVCLMDLTPFLKHYREDGRGAAGYHPELMLALLLYAYCRGISSSRSSREIERSCQLDVGFRVVTAQQKPDHATISRFRLNYAPQLKELFMQVLQLCANAGLVKLGTVSLDGTKLQANAALEANKTREKLTEMVEAMLAKAETTDKQEDELYGQDKRGDELPEDLANPQKRVATLRKAKVELERIQQASQRADKIVQQAEQEYQEKLEYWRNQPSKKPGSNPTKPKPLERLKINTTDPASRIQRTRQGYCQGYNAQAVVSDDQIILSAELCDEANDMRQLAPMAEAMHETLQRLDLPATQIEHLLADSGYWTEQAISETLQYLSVNQLPAQLLVAPPKQRRTIERPVEDSPPPENLSPLQQIEHKVGTPTGRSIYRRRSQTIEPVFGQIKGARNLGKLRMRGFDLANCEWKLITLTHNLLKLFRKKQQSRLPAASNKPNQSLNALLNPQLCPA